MPTYGGEPDKLEELNNLLAQVEDYFLKQGVEVPQITIECDPPQWQLVLSLANRMLSYADFNHPNPYLTLRGAWKFVRKPLLDVVKVPEWCNPK